MSIICPNLKNEEVAREFEELKNATSEAAAYHIWSLNNGNSIDKAPNGEPSKLFSDLLEHYNGDRVAAIQAKARTYSNSFRDWFGDWTNTIKPGNIIFGHPAIGKTYSLESGKYKDKLIDWDEEFNTKRDKWIEDHSNTVKGTPEYKKARNEYLIYPERHPDYVEFIKSEWERVKNKVKKEGKILFASPHNLLKMFPQDFNRIINLKDDDFIKRNIGRGGKEKESKLWKEGINETISNTTGIPVEYLNENQYFEDYLNKHLGISKVADENGEPKLIGVWDMEKPYKRFKAVGAKRYMYEYEDGTMNMTVSGLNKKYAMPYLMEENNNHKELIFEKFGEGMFIPAGHTGKLTLTYIEDEMKGTLVDYLGNQGEFHEQSAVHMEPQSYFMSLIGDYIKFLTGVQYVEL